MFVKCLLTTNSDKSAMDEICEAKTKPTIFDKHPWAAEKCQVLDNLEAP